MYNIWFKHSEDTGDSIVDTTEDEHVAWLKISGHIRTLIENTITPYTVIAFLTEGSRNINGMKIIFKPYYGSEWSIAYQYLPENNEPEWSK